MHITLHRNQGRNFLFRTCFYNFISRASTNTCTNNLHLIYIKVFYDNIKEKSDRLLPLKEKTKTGSGPTFSLMLESSRDDGGRENGSASTPNPTLNKMSNYIQ